MQESFCQYYNQGDCRSCSQIRLPYGEQLAQKENRVRRDLDLSDSFRMEPAVGSSTLGFRNRVKMLVTGTSAKPLIGLAGDEQLDQGRELLSCPIHHPQLNEIFRALPSMITKFGIVPYRIDLKSGELKGLIAFYSTHTQQCYLRFVLRSRQELAKIVSLSVELQATIPTLVCVSANIQPIAHALLEGPEEIAITERQSIGHVLGGLRVELAPQAFVQTNCEVAEKLYRSASQWITEAKVVKFLDLYCGQGAFSFAAASSVQEALGVEINPRAVEMAERNAKSLGLSHLRFIAANAGQIGEEVLSFAPDLLLVNPPRRGLGESLALAQKSRPQHFLYSSCSIESLAKDFRKLSENYRCRKVQIFDMFPHTDHFETLLWMERN